MLKKLGVIGGMGPEATSFYYARVIARTKAESDQEHINMIILSHATMPDRTQAILTGNKLPFLKAITQDARDLEMLGVENIAIPCNTSHYFLEDIQYGRGECQICSRGSSKSEEDRDHGNRWNDAGKDLPPSLRKIWNHTGSSWRSLPERCDVADL